MRPRTLILAGWMLLCALGLPGCFVLQVGVSNPAPNLPRIAVAPFVNLSAERSVDGRRFAEAYYTELQKVPGFQVIPVGVVDSALHDYGLNLDTPADMEKLIEILDVDGVCFGAITEYNPYYPPRLGLQISWYTTKHPEFQPGLPIEHPASKPYQRKGKRQKSWSENWLQPWNCLPDLSMTQQSATPVDGASAPVFRAQSQEPQLTVPPLSIDEQGAWERELLRAMNVGETGGETVPPPTPDFDQPRQRTGQPQQQAQAQTEQQRAEQNQQRWDTLRDMLRNPHSAPEPAPEERAANPPRLPAVPQIPVSPDGQQFPGGWGEFSEAVPERPLLPGENPRPESPFPQPFMSYTRVFDGADADFTAALKNFLELSGDQRSGGWTGYLHRSEDFIRFCMNRMIVEMLQLHGGEARRRFVVTSRKYQ